jgi:hypothetical protein
MGNVADHAFKKLVLLTRDDNYDLSALKSNIYMSVPRGPSATIHTAVNLDLVGSEAWLRNLDLVIYNIDALEKTQVLYL